MVEVSLWSVIDLNSVATMILTRENTKDWFCGRILKTTNMWPWLKEPHSKRFIIPRHNAVSDTNTIQMWVKLLEETDSSL